MISVDGDTSTNDTVLVLANGMAENDIITEDSKDYQNFMRHCFMYCVSFLRKIAGDGEGCTCLFEVQVKKCGNKRTGKGACKVDCHFKSYKSGNFRTRCKLGKNPLCNGLFRCGLRTGKSRYLL